MAKIGKNVLENLTQAMYNDSRIIYREYIQNSSDQIDIAISEQSFPEEKLEIIITIDTKKRNIIIADNANGIPEKDVQRKLEDVADSEKIQGKAKGFRGIGRLGGIGYCKELRFVTTYFGEDVETTMIWNADRLKDVIGDSDNHDSAEKVLDEVISYKKKKVDVNAHYFRVELLGINNENDQLLDYKEVKQYISEVAPVAFKSTFIFRSKIEKFIKDNPEIPPMPCYSIGIREEGKAISYIFKDYPTKIYKMNGLNKVGVDDIKDVHMDKICDDNGETIAWIWYAISNFKGAINDLGNPWKGLRLRQFNIQIGDKTALSKFFKESRGNSYFMGEVHTVSKKLRPNARRDYFNETVEVRDFEYAFTEYAKGLSKLYKSGSEINSSYKKLEELRDLQREYEERSQNGFNSPEAKKKLEEKLDKAKEDAKESIAKIKKMTKQANEKPQSAIAQMVQVVTEVHKLDVDKFNVDHEELKQKRENVSKEKQQKEKTKLIVDDLTSYSKAERKLVSRIYEVIHRNLAFDDAKALVNKIQEELKRS